MPRHRTGDPWDVLELAAASLRFIGGILLMLAMLGVLVLIVRLRVDEYIDGKTIVVQLAARTLPSLLAGGLFLVLAHFVKRRRPWAAGVALALTMIQFAGMLFGTAMIVMAVIHEGEITVLVVPAVFMMLVTYALGHLVFHLTRTFDAMRQVEPAVHQKAFEPIVAATPVRPAAPPLPVQPLPPPSSSSFGDPHAPSTPG
jgi:hypothetical protein